LWFIISYNRSFHDPTIFILKKKDHTVKIKTFNKVYGIPPTKLVHLRRLRLKTNGDDQNDKR